LQAHLRPAQRILQFGHLTAKIAVFAGQNTKND